MKTQGVTVSCARASRLRSVATSACVLLSPGSDLQCRYALTPTNAACQHSQFLVRANPCCFLLYKQAGRFPGESSPSCLRLQCNTVLA